MWVCAYMCASVSLKLAPLGDTAAYFFTGRRMGVFLAKCEHVDTMLTHALPARTVAEHIAYYFAPSFTAKKGACDGTTGTTAAWPDGLSAQSKHSTFEESVMSLFTRLPSYLPLYIQQCKHFQTR